MVLILNPDKPTQITVTLANIIFGALFGDRKVTWEIVIQDEVAKMCSVPKKSKPFGLNLFLFHFYQSLDLLRDKERSMYKSTKLCFSKTIDQNQNLKLERAEKKDPIWMLDQKDNSFGKVIEVLKEIRDYISIEREVTRKVYELMDKTYPEDLLEEVENLLIWEN